VAFLAGESGYLAFTDMDRLATSLRKIREQFSANAAQSPSLRFQAPLKLKALPGVDC